MTTVAPASPNARSSSDAAERARPRRRGRSATVDALARGEPVGLDHVRRPEPLERGRAPPSTVRHVRDRAAGIPWRSHSSFAHAFEPSIRAAAPVGPEHAARPRSSSSSASPATSGASGPTTVRSMPLALDEVDEAGDVVGLARRRTRASRGDPGVARRREQLVDRSGSARAATRARARDRRRRRRGPSSRRAPAGRTLLAAQARPTRRRSARRRAPASRSRYFARGLGQVVDRRAPASMSSSQPSSSS